MRGVVCDVCGATGRLWTRSGDRDLLRCPSCRFAWVPQGLQRTDGVSIYEDAEGALFTSQADYYLDESARAAAADKLAWVGGFVPGGTLLDVGANVGLFVDEAKRRYDALGIEPSASAVALGRKNGWVGVEVGSIYDAALTGPFDAITMFDVIEHLEDPRAALARSQQWLAPGGRLFLTTPDSGSLLARTLGSHWYHLDLTQHISIFSAANLTRLLHDTGFRVVSRRTFGRSYRFSYIERRLREQGSTNLVLRLAHVASLPMRLFPGRRVSINLGDVMGLVAARRD